MSIQTTPEGLLAAGGNLHPKTLINAYALGIFPWFSRGDPILWWHPEPRLVLFPSKFHLSKNLRRFIRRSALKSKEKHSKSNESPDTYRVSFNQDFNRVIQECGNKRTAKRPDTWISPEITKAYKKLHTLGFAHSVEVWDVSENLVGGLYGVALGQIFFGESMFSHVSEASKIALYWLCQLLEKSGFVLIDCQVETEHLKSLGAEGIPRAEFLQYLHQGKAQLKQPTTVFDCVNP